MQERRLRPGDVLDDYCPRERRVTDHAIVAMIDDNIKQTRCVVCDAEHEYKQAKVPPQRKRKPALFTQVLDGLQGPTRPHLPDVHQDELISEAPDVLDMPKVPEESQVPQVLAAPEVPHAPEAPEPQMDGAPIDDDGQPQGDVFEGPIRRKLFRAALPRPEGQPPPSRVIPEFTIRQPGSGRHRHGGGGRRRGGQHQQQGHNGPMRFGRGAHGQRSNGPRGHGGSRAGGSRRGGKKR